MDVYQSIISVGEERVSENLVEYVEQAPDHLPSMTVRLLRSIEEEPNIALIRNGAIGYYNGYGKTFLSNPESERGLALLDAEGKRLLADPQAAAFHNQRDRYVFSDLSYHFTIGTFENVVDAFVKEGYGLFHFKREISKPTLTEADSPSQVIAQRPLTLDEFLASFSE